MASILTATEGGALTTDRFYVRHGEGHRSLVLLGTERYRRFLAKAGFPPVKVWRFNARFHHLDGREGRASAYECPADEEACFDSARFFEDDRPAEGSVLLRLEAVEFASEPDPALAPPPGDFNGILLVFRPGSYITGVHLYHGVSPAGKFFLLGHAIKGWLKRAYGALYDFAGPWPHEALGASVVRSSMRGTGIAFLHTDHATTAAPAFLEYRGPSGVRRSALPLAPANATLKVEIPPQRDGKEEWGQLLCALPPFGISRFVTGQSFDDGRLTFDHNYFQQPLGAAKTGEVRWFDPSLLEGTVIGPSHPWPVFHDENTETLVAMCKQLEPERPHVYDARVFDSEGRLVLFKEEAVSVAPFGMSVFDVSAELRRRGISRLEGTYLITHNRRHAGALLPSRIHAQGIYRFGGEYWNSVQSDASIWASPESPVPGIEALSAAKVRRKQYWFAPVVDSAELETLLPVANLSYSLAYDMDVVLVLRYSEGSRVLGEREFTLKPFGSAVIRIADIFGAVMTRRDGMARGCVTIYPKTGITYCASIVVRDRRTGVFVIEHVLPLPKLPHEVAS